MNKYFLAGFALVLLGLYVGLQAGSWITPTKTKVKVVKLKPKKVPPQIKVVRVEVPVPIPVEPERVCAPMKTVKRSVSSVPKISKTIELEKLSTLPAKAPEMKKTEPESMLPALKSVAQPAQALEVQNAATQPLLAPTIKSIKTED